MKCPDPNNINYPPWLPETAENVIKQELNRTDNWVQSWQQGNEAAKREIDIWYSFANDPAMESVYEDLGAAVLNSEQQLSNFLDAAWGASMGSLSVAREDLKHTSDLIPKIGRKALELKKLLEQLDRSVLVPGELLSVFSLLQSTPDTESRYWVGRNYILGEKPRNDVPQVPGGAIEIHIDTESDTDYPRREPDWYVDPYLWKGAPSLPNLLSTMARAIQINTDKADDAEIEWWRPELDGAVAAALESRQENARAEYLRAFLSILRERGFSLNSETPSHMRAAIVGVARVVLGYTENDALAHPGMKGEKDRPLMYKETLEKTLTALLSEQ